MSLFSRLHSLALGQDENFTTESLAIVLEHLLAACPPAGLRLAELLSAGLVSSSTVDAALVSVTTRSHTDARSIHDRTKQLLSAWFNSEADAAATVSSMQPVLDEAESILTDLETILAEQYDFDPEELAAQRQETLQSVPDIFATPTPSG